jgi:predicted nuclease of predicted toxin-antitoxin system
MKVLLDHNIPHGLRDHFPKEHEVYTASYLGWSGYDDSKILSEAAKQGFEVFVTLDSGITEQQALSEWEIGVIVLEVHPATPAHLERVIPLVKESLAETAQESRLTIIGGGR